MTLAILNLYARDGAALFRDRQSIDIPSGVNVVLGEEAANGNVDAFDLRREVTARCAVGVLHCTGSTCAQDPDVLTRADGQVGGDEACACYPSLVEQDGVARGCGAVVRGDAIESQHRDGLRLSSNIRGDTQARNHKVGGSLEPEPSSQAAAGECASVGWQREVLRVVDAGAIGADLSCRTFLAACAAVVDVRFEVTTRS